MEELMSQSEEETIEFAEDFIENLPENIKVICLFGELGSGKTVLVKGIAKALGIDSYTVKSPTYTFIREYTHNKGRLVHVDLYRIEEPDDLLFEQIEEFAEQKGTLVVIEWADRMKDRLPENRKDICFEHVNENTRKISTF